MSNLSFQNGGAFLCAVDDANDHILSVWNWQKEKQLAEVKVTGGFLCLDAACVFAALRHYG